MAKTCTACGYAVDSLLEEAEPASPEEDCPKCGGLGTMMEEGADLDERGKSAAE